MREKHTGKHTATETQYCKHKCEDIREALHERHTRHAREALAERHNTIRHTATVVQKFEDLWKHWIRDTLQLGIL